MSIEWKSAPGVMTGLTFYTFGQNGYRFWAARPIGSKEWKADYIGPMMLEPEVIGLYKTAKQARKACETAYRKLYPQQEES
jgi:hypothetical protein